MILFVNGCVREEACTLELAKAVLSKATGDIQEICLYPDGPTGLTPESLHQREGDCDEKDYFEIYSNHSWRDFDVIFVRMLSKQIRD